MLTFNPVTERILPIASDTILCIQGRTRLILAHNYDTILKERFLFIWSLDHGHLNIFNRESAYFILFCISCDNRVVLSNDFVLDLADGSIGHHFGEQDVILILSRTIYHYIQFRMGMRDLFEWSLNRDLPVTDPLMISQSFPKSPESSMS